jgi:lipopolysaccharide transport system permease protein
MVVFSALLAGVGGVTGEQGIPYPIFSYSGLLIWLYFADALTRSSTSLVTNNVLVSKVYFPRLTAPLSGVISPMLDFAIGSVLLVGIMIYYSFPLTTAFFLVPLFLVLAVLAASAFGIWLSAINVRYRDVGYAMPFVVQIWMFVSPVVYSASKVQGKAKFFYSLNPMAGVVEGFRYAVLGRGTLDWSMVLIGTAVSLAVLTGGMLYFRRVERTFADAI